MTTDVERLIVRLEATQRQFQKQLARASETADRSARRIEGRFQRMNKTLEGGALRFGRALVGALAGGVAIREAQRFIDASVRIQNALKVAGLSGEELKRVYDRLFESAQRNAAPFESLVELFSRASLVQKELGISTDELLNFTDQIALALRVSGKSAEQASGALLQLSQALGSGVVRAEEFNSILEGALPIAQAAAAGLEEAGGSVAKLRQLVIDGEVSSKAFFHAFQAGSIILQERARDVELTSGQAFGNLRNALIRAAGEFNETTGASRILADNIQTLASIIGGFDVSGMLGSLDALRNKMAEVGNSPFFARMAELLGADPNAVYRIVPGQGLVAEPPGANTTDKSARLPNESFDRRIGAAFANQRLKPVSLRDFPVSDDDDDGKKQRLNDFEREVAQIMERTASIRAMTEAQAGINPLMEDYGFAVERAAAVQEMLAAAQRAGIAITPELRAQIETLADSYATAVAEAERLAERQDEIRKSADEFRALAQSALSGFIQDIRSGTSATEALLNALNNVADRLIDLALNSLFQNLFKGGGLMDLFANARGNAFSGGRVVPFGKGGVVNRPTVFPMARGMGLMGEAGPEAVMPLRRGPGGRLGVEASSGGTTEINIIDQAGTEKRTERRRGPDGREMVNIIIERVKSEMAGGNFDKIMGARFGQMPSKVRR